MKKIVLLILAFAGFVGACEDTTSPGAKTAGDPAGSASSQEEHKRPSELHPRQFSP